MSLIGANALPLLANIKAREDENLTFPVIHSDSESTLPSRDKSCRVVLISEKKGSK